MNPISEQEKRQGIASELADIEMRQKAIIQWNRAIRNLLMGDEQEALDKIAAEDEKNLRAMEAVLTNFGMRVEPKAFTKGFTDLVSQRIDDQNTPVVEKLGAYALARQNQAMCGYLVHKSAQLSQLDVKEALGLFEGIQSSLEKQVGQVANIVEKAGVRSITGEEPAAGIAGRLRDVAATMAGAVISALGTPTDELGVLNLLRVDHMKARTLFREIKRAGTALDKNDLFYQLRVDLLSHAEAEQDVVYRYFQQFPDIKQAFDQSWSEHDELRSALDVLSNLDTSSKEFQDRMKDLRELVEDHVDREEGEIFKLIREKSDEEDLRRLAKEFLDRKAMIQEKMSPLVASPSRSTDSHAASGSSASV